MVVRFFTKAPLNGRDLVRQKNIPNTNPPRAKEKDIGDLSARKPLSATATGASATTNCNSFSFCFAPRKEIRREVQSERADGRRSWDLGELNQSTKAEGGRKRGEGGVKA
jgi:hypothetical protein